MSKSQSSKMLFETYDGIKNSCYECSWQDTNMCPMHADFIGRPMFDGKLSYGDICHRFYLTPKVRQQRWELLMKKLEENVDVVD